ncbi:phage antirepressor KilAC domain-containing protein [Collinsella stercoris]|uniref:Phage antirepressor protein n=1 Tax=Collinsella stercoris DSM 13279 TaxID=445975 RepID=B6GAL4_9ACTN|nr:phage antirepressor KilAC domain-containing protein [Collinsella stercoris]EEA90687.1 phage antirepressor protein [Collinsella stercoris DSM 13279]UEA45490.1 phage antirepressor KilAC domain-containing protein [Collinsella stercoris DSM 13279]UWP11986.1 phage antirepressor KilAC domain-containing protein [Collinsella stercoris]
MDTSDIIPFTSEQFGTVRTIEEDGRVIFCGKDVAAALGYAKPNNALNAHCKGDALIRGITDNLGREQQARFITEGDLYRLIASSKLPSAQQFESWVFDEVLPSIRKRGGYMAAREDETPEQIMARALMLAKDTMDRQKREIDELRPKALFADAVAASDGTCLVGELAKMLTQSGFQIGQNRLFALLREEGYLGKSGSNRNVPIQRYVEQGLFRIKETAITHSDGHVTLTRTTKVTGKGQAYFMARYCGEAA